LKPVCRHLQADNEKKLEQMRQTVDEKLHATLEARLGESFKQVAERLELVHRGLGEMQRLASDVGSLNRVLNNVKTRGIFGEVQLAGLLEQVFTPEQYAVNVETVPGSSGARVEFAIRLPGQGSVDADNAAVVAHRRQVPSRGLRAPAGSARPGRCGCRRSQRPRRIEQCACVWRRGVDSRQVPGATAHVRFRHLVRAHRRACTPKRCAALDLVEGHAARVPA
jgi:hypothetical protein